ncbi:hypothetical protein HUJ04_004802 [Dendroctonus ponderosae]|uniref:DUF4758 domain-containing protein n=1 Tax=Dendroctonus ponderosae TaxID=77166 RepID=A0AAR5PTZ8_DENPD|nr:hypothetical protein HUJ04_004802 [Dendroctonus ponderosae]
MPPVRWKLCCCVTAIFVQVIAEAAAQQMQDSISMSSDGWRPIVGSRRQNPTGQGDSEVRQYANPSQAFDVVPADVVNLETTTLPYGQQPTAHFRAPVKHSGNYKDRKAGASKQKQTYKTVSPYYMTSGQGNQQLKKLQAINKPLLVQNKMRKPIRGQMVSHSTRSEIFVPPPISSTGSGGYSFIKSAPASNVKTRETQGFGLLSNNFGQSQHLELARFPLTGESGIVQRPTYFLAQPAQNDDYSRNLVPPPRSRGQQKGKQDTKISLYAFKEGPSTDSSAHVPQFGARPNQFLPQVVPTYEFSSQQQQQQQPRPQTLKEQAVDVQVTKENLKQYTPSGAPSPATFGPIPARNSFPIGYVDYNFQKSSPSNSPSPLTYEVTEGKWIDTPSQQYQFRPQDGFFQFQNIRQAPPNARPGLLFQAEGSTPSPPVFQAPLVDLSVPAFLPTPYKTEGTVIPTSPTQSEAATVFAQVSNKMNKYRNNALQESPLFFDIKDVSTHYPILGKPEVQSEDGTDYPVGLKETGEISNEITTTQKERVRRPTKQPVTQPTSTRDPTKARITNRRKPRPRKPSTTTTEAPSAETYEPIKSHENVEEAPIEVERPLRRRRPKPTGYRPQEAQAHVEQEPIQNQKDAEEEPATRQRGRHRQRNRPSTESTQRKRLRPAHENLKQKHFVEEVSETPVEQEQLSFENDAQNYYSPESAQFSENGQRFETEVPSRQYESVQEQPIQQENKPFIEEIHSATETARGPEPNTRLHLPENEVDFTTSAEVIPDVEDFASTTLQPTTTTMEISTVKSTRIRRPIKYDNSNRPRFSVKEYRQRLNQHTSTTTPSTTTQARTGSDNLRLRFPSRLRTRPSPTTASSRVDEDVTDETTTTPLRSRFKPKEPRHETTTPESNGIITEKSIKAVNTRLRPFGRTKPMSETTTTASKISIRPNLFSARRRAGYPSLKSRIHNKKNDIDEENAIETTTRVESEPEGVDPLSAAESATTELSTSTTDAAEVENASTEVAIEESITEDIMKTDDYFQSQRVSDLTSSFKDYDKPGIFNSVAPTSRSIPNYFTISTDDPILPIEAFFPSLKEKSKMR